jgi:capsular polysaccharide transport system permease protein
MTKFVSKTIQHISCRLWWYAIALLIAVNVYWSGIATDRYVSKAHVVLQSPDIAPPELSFSSMLSGPAGSNTADLLLLREHLISMDMLKKLDAEFDLRGHFSSSEIDYFSRLSDSKAPLETFFEYFLTRVNARLDDYSGVLIVEAQMFSPQMSQKVVQRLLQYGEQHMNAMGQRLAEDQLAFIEKQVNELNNRLIKANQAVLRFQNQEGILSPSEEAISMASVIAQLQAELISLRAQKKVLASFQSIKSAEMLKVNSQIDSLEQQIVIEKNKLTSSKGNALNAISLEYETIKLKAQFAQELYANALATLEATRVEAARKLKQVSVLAEPNLPEYSIEPQRMYLMALSTILIILSSLILSMVFTIIKDHKD